MAKPFQFKQFTVKQDQCAMKIGTDGVLLGAIATTEHNPFSVLDIGTGTGVLALMLAQRTHAELIDALEIDDDAYEQAVNNFEESPWGDRLFCYHASLNEFSEEIDDTYDLIICNPPFYSETYKTNQLQRDLARFQDAMPLKHLIVSVSKLLSLNGVFSVILPFKEKDNLLQIAATHHLFPFKITLIKGTPNSKTKRVVIEFTFSERDITHKELIIETDRHIYTDDYISLTKDFYLKM